MFACAAVGLDGVAPSVLELAAAGIVSGTRPDAGQNPLTTLYAVCTVLTMKRTRTAATDARLAVAYQRVSTDTDDAAPVDIFNGGPIA